MSQIFLFCIEFRVTEGSSSSRGGNRQIHLPLIGEGRDGEYPVRDLFCHHSVLDMESPASIEGFKLFSPLIIRSTMRLRVGARNDREQVAPHPSPPRVGEGAITLHNSSNYAIRNDKRRTGTVRLLFVIFLQDKLF